MLIDDFLPRFDVAERHAVVVRATSAEAYAAIRRIDLARSWAIRGLFAVRGLPGLLGGRPRHRSWNLDDIVRAGFVLLAEDSGVELVLGVIGKFWMATGGVRQVAAENFVGFEEPGFAKAVWNFRVDPMARGRVRVTTETRIRCTDDVGRRRFLRYWRVVGPFSGFIRSRALALVKADVERERGRSAGNMAGEGGRSA